MTNRENETRLIKHEWWQITVVIITVFGLFLWQQSESRSDYRELRSFTESNINAIRQDAKDFREMWAKETKEFHGRIVSVEKRTQL